MTLDLVNKKLLSITKKIPLEYKLCDHCLGRIFAKIESGLTNKKRGQILRKYHRKINEIKVDDCWLCSGLLNEIKHFVDLILNSLEGYEFNTFLIGSKLDEDILEKEQELYNFTGSEHSESIKTELNREIGKILENRLDQEVNFENPTIMIVIDTSYDIVNLQISSLFIYGRYKKFRRDIPQTRWFCTICRGKGCKKCNYSGKLYKTSVEELIANNFLVVTEGDEESFHGCGREDIDVRTLGTGRPFVLEIKNPKKRKLDLQDLENKINKENKESIEVSEFRYSNKAEVARLKGANFRKKYRVVLRCGKSVNNEKLIKATLSLRGKQIGQLTPSRVAHRRADMVREKYIYDCKIESIDGAIATLTLETESGTYIKELVSGDNGRTKPNLSDLIGVPCIVTELDVIEIKGE
jgi:tRNA pseudouridine synthase 10